MLFLIYQIIHIDLISPKYFTKYNGYFMCCNWLYRSTEFFKKQHNEVKHPYINHDLYNIAAISRNILPSS